VANEEVLFRRRLREIVIQRYGSLDRFSLETDFAKGHLSQILRGRRSPSLATIMKLAKALDVRVGDFFTNAGALGCRSEVPLKCSDLRPENADWRLRADR
jgi:transcriptional regulator with XRE-family HTH domain